MPKEFSRTRRLSEQLRRELAQLIRNEVRDPRAVMVSITAIDVSRDLAHAKVYITLLGDAEERADVISVLNQSAPMLRRQLGRMLHIRTVPRLVFEYDETVERGARLSALINDAVAADAARHNDDDPESTDKSGQDH